MCSCTRSEVPRRVRGIHLYNDHHSMYVLYVCMYAWMERLFIWNAFFIGAFSHLYAAGREADACLSAQEEEFPCARP